MSRINIRKLEAAANTTTYNVDFPNSLLLTAPRHILSPDLASSIISIEKLTDATYRATRHACSAHASAINFQVTIQKGEPMSCRVRRIFKEINLVESYVVTSINGKFEGGASEIGLIGKLMGYGLEDVKKDEFWAFLTGAFVIELMILEEEEREDRRNMVQSTEAWDWEAVEREEKHEERKK